MYISFQLIMAEQLNYLLCPFKYDIDYTTCHLMESIFILLSQKTDYALYIPFIATPRADLDRR